MRQWPSPLLLLPLLAIFLPPSIAVDTITPTTPLTDGQILASSGGSFTLGFFSPGSSKHRYLGIWYQKVPNRTVVWVANRENPLTNSTGVLTINSNGSLALVDGSSTVFWSSASSSNASSPVAQLLDNGNFVLRAADDSNAENFAWQSFDYPSDTLLPGMKLGWNLRTGINRYLTAWKSSDDPSLGDYSFRLDIRELPELYMYQGSARIYASGPWNGLQFSGVPELKSNDILSFSFVSTQEEAYYSFAIDNSSIISRFLMSASGEVQRFIWLDTINGWSLFWQDPKDQCDNYVECGPFGVCDSNNSPICSCFTGFQPRSQQNWNLRDWTSGCSRVTPLDCQGDGFLTMNNMKLPDTTNATLNASMSLNECRKSCLSNCSCMAYANANISGGGSGCITWPNQLIDLRHFQTGGQDLFVRLAASDLPKPNTGSSKKNATLAIALSTVSGLLLLGLCGYCIWNKRKKGHITLRTESASGVLLGSNRAALDHLAKDHPLNNDNSTGADVDLPLVDINTILAATNNFGFDNKLGEGGFGPVYKGKLGYGLEIAVKRLSKNSLQGLDEFKNEVKLIAKLQHRNLVRLLGCCIHEEERMLVYEYMHNRSLDTYLFDETRQNLLNWQSRFNIILGVCRGLLYLHQDSRFIIIHRDLKASNILLDSEMNPKISDFGLARIFGGNQNDAYTRRVVGTYGYMSPEYAMDGIFSMKSDVFSFGVLVLEIVSGKKNRGFYSTELHLNLLSYAWKLWKEGRGLELLDGSINSSYSASEVLRCVQVGLLCVQEQASDRPVMSAVSMMLGSESASLPEPNEPGFSTGRMPVDTESSSAHSVNEVTLTMINCR